jgi:DtxR family Mn-dependent transcriptional regulator
VRAHRLWERYLADEVRVGPEAVHRLADRKEHLLTGADIEELAARLGYPERDPHGDPIPQATGELKVLAAVPLTVAPHDEALRIVHVEDEPESVYARLAALELDVDRILFVTESSPKQLTVELEGTRLELSPVDAANVFVVPEPAGRAGVPTSLADLDRGQAGHITALRMSGLRRRRLLDLGFTPGARVECALRGPLGEPTGYRIRGTLVALREEEARRIEIERLSEGDER